MVVAIMTWRVEAGATEDLLFPSRGGGLGEGAAIIRVPSPPPPSRNGKGKSLTGMISYLASWCGSAPWAGGLLVGLLVAGAAGSTMHCVPMCGGFVLGQVADGMAAAADCAALRVAAHQAWRTPA